MPLDEGFVLKRRELAGPASAHHGALVDEAPDSLSGAEAAIEGLPGALTLAPSAVIPAIGGELLLDEEAEVRAELTTDSVRSGLLAAGPLAVAGLVVNGANVIVTVVLARLLSSRGYGSLNQLTGLFLIVSMPGSAVIVGVVRRLAAARAHGSAHLVRHWAFQAHRALTVAVAAFAFVVVAVGGHLATLIGQRSADGAVAILIAGGAWILLSFDRGLLQAHRDYRVLAANLLVEGGVRTVAMLALVGMGFGAAGAAVGVLIAESVTALHARVMADRSWSVEGERPRGVRSLLRLRIVDLGSGEERRELRIDLIAALVALAMLALLQNIDVIILGREGPKLSGSYAAVSVTSKALVFGAIVLGGYLLPEAAIRWREGGHALRQLAVTLLLLAVPAGVLLAAAIAAPHLLLRLVFSSRYLGAENALLPLVAAMVCLSVTVMLTMYLLAVGRRWVSALLVCGAAALSAGCALAHGAPVATARTDLVVQVVLAAVTVVGFVLVHHRRRVFAKSSRPSQGEVPR